MESLAALLAEFARQAPEGQGSLVHPGTTPWADRPEFPVAAEAAGLGAICPPGRVLSLFNNRLNLIGEAEKTGVPNLLLGYEPLNSAREIERLVESSGPRSRYPFVLKAVRGARAWGLLVVHEPEDLKTRVPLWFEQLRRNVGEVIVFAERYLEGARRVLVPFVRFADGTFRSFPISDGSLQHRNRKIIEFCPASGLEPELELLLREYAERVAGHCGFVGVGTLDFMAEGTRGFVVDGTARLNLGFALWEQVARTNAVAWQLAALEGGRSGALPPAGEAISGSGSSGRSGVLMRIYAEDPLLQLPQPGAVREVSVKREWSFPGTEAELTLTVEEGSEVSSQGDGLVGILRVVAKDRKHALTTARGILAELWIAGALQTNERFLGELLAQPWVREGIFHAGFVEEEFVPSVRAPIELLRVLAAAGAELVPAGAEPARWAVGDQWVRADPEVLRWVSSPERFEAPGGRGISGVAQLSDGSSTRVCVFPLSDDKWQGRAGAWVLAVRRVSGSAGDRRRPRILALATGRIHSVLYRADSLVPAHEALLLIDSLGVLVPHALPVEVRVRKWNVAADDAVIAGQELAEFEFPPTA
jgi:acetyl/propionyl-CoA carboxylase alpha subunit